MTADYDVVIIGAGAAGIAAARGLASAGLSLLVLEARDRAGGRAHTQMIEGMPLDLGCGWLHSAERNPWAQIAEASGFAVDRGASAWFKQYRNLGFAEDAQRTAHRAWEAFQHRLEYAPPASDRAADALITGDIWNSYFQALSGYMNGAALEQLSIADYLAYDHASSEENWRVTEGFGALITASLPLLPLALSIPVTAIDHSGPCLRIETTSGAMTARAAIVTVSTNVLASGAIRFDPQLDDWLEAASSLPLGLANKLFLAADAAAGLEPETHLLGNPRLAETGSYYIRPFGRPVVECFFGGTGARALEAAGPEETLSFAVGELAALLGSKIRGSLRMLATTAWGRARWIGGSYSHALPCNAGRRAALARPFDNRLFFAGEATHSADFSTAHGAYWSGARAAAEVIQAVGLPDLSG